MYLSKSKREFAALALLASTALPAHAQDRVADIKSAEATARPMITSTTGDGSGSQLNSAFRLVSSTDETDATFTLSTQGEGKDGFTNFSFSVTATAPLDEDTGRAAFITDAGLPGQLSLGLNLTMSFVKTDDIVWNDDQIGALEIKSNRACKALPANVSLSEEKLIEACQLTTPFRNREKKFLSSDELKSLVGYYQGPVNHLKSKPYFALSLNGTVGTEKFEFFDPTSLTPDEARKTSYSASASIGYLPHLSSKVFLIGGFEAKRSFSAPDDETYCATGGTGASVKCVTGPFAPPVMEQDYKLKGTVRVSFNLPFGPNDGTPIGIDLSGAFDFHDDTWGMTLPVYFVLDKEGSLTGGIRAAYDSKKDDFQVGVFIGKSFGFLKL